MSEIDSLAIEIREINAANGWNPVTRADWVNDRHRIPSMLALIHSEINEAHDELCVDELDDDVMAVLATELADIEIRVLDLVGGLTPDFAACVARVGQVFVAEDSNRAFLEMHKLVTKALEAYRVAAQPSVEFLDTLAHLYFFNRCFGVGICKIDMDAAVRAKLEKNRGRGYRHGDKRV